MNKKFEHVLPKIRFLIVFSGAGGTAAGSTRERWIKVEDGIYMRHFQKKLEYVLT
jgi:hypothetical protein